MGKVDQDEGMQPVKHACLICGQPATVQFSIDIDVAPWRACADHSERTRLALMALLSGNETDSRMLLGLTPKEWRRRMGKDKRTRG